MSLKSFTQIALSPPLLEVIQSLEYQGLTPVQALAIPALLEGKDVIAQAQTGSGKTAAFAIPLLEQITTDHKKIQALILSPTRELCQQVAREIRKLGRYRKDLHVLTLFGGRPASLDRKSLVYGAQIVVGTPGRLLDHLKRKSLDLSAVTILVLDEADRMLDMGFRDSVEQILQKVPVQRQTSLFSATFPPTIEALSKRYMKDPLRLTVAVPKGKLQAIDHLFVQAEAHEKNAATLAFLRSRNPGSTLIFCNLKTQVDELLQHLKQAGHSVDKLHGNLEQQERERVMAKFRNQSIRILIATDVAARGIDIAGLDAVINYDMPADPEQYVHRTGRTGRAGAKGTSVSLIMAKEKPKLERLEAYTETKYTVLGAASLTGNAPPKATSKTTAQASMDTISISGGRKDKLRPGDILGALTGDVGIPGDHVGKIEILDHVSFVAISRDSFSVALSRLKQGRIKNRRFVVQGVR